jgi:hypothetical protein
MESVDREANQPVSRISRDGGGDPFSELSTHFQKRLNLLVSGEVPVRRGVASGFAAEQELPKSLQPVLLEALLQESDAGVARSLINALESTGIEPARLVPSLLILLRSDSMEVAEVAARALGRLPTQPVLSYLGVFLTDRDEDTDTLRMAFARGVEERNGSLSLAEFKEVEDRIQGDPTRDILDALEAVQGKSTDELTVSDIAYVFFSASRVDIRSVRREALRTLSAIIGGAGADRRGEIAPALLWAAPAWMDRGSFIQKHALEMLHDCRAELPGSGLAILPISEEIPPTMQAYQAYVAALLGGERALSEALDCLVGVAWSLSGEGTTQREAVQYLGSLCYLSGKPEGDQIFAELEQMLDRKAGLSMDQKIEVIDSLALARNHVDESLRLLGAVAASRYSDIELRLKACQIIAEIPFQNSDQTNTAYSILHYLRGESDQELVERASHVLEMLSLGRRGGRMPVQR